MSLSFAAAAAECPGQTAVVFEGTSHTFAALRPAVAKARRWLAELGAGDSRTPAPVALVAENRMESILVLYALIDADLPVVLVHPRLTCRERENLLADSRPVLYLDEKHLDDLSAALQIPAKDTRGDNEAPRCVDPPADPPADPPLAILYTSGTTGRPRGAVLTRAAFVAAAAASADNLGWQDDDRWLLCMPLSHVGGLSILTRCLIARRPLVMTRAPGFDPEALCHVLRRDRVTLVSLVPTMLRRVLDCHPPAAPPVHLRAVLLGGASAPDDLLHRAVARGWPVLTTYGLTEACSQVTTQRRGTLASPDLGAGPSVAGMEVRIVEGQIQVRGSAMMSGYLTQDIAPFLPGGWFPTGDLGYLDPGGRLHLLARRTDLIVTGGENVYPLEVEGIVERCPGVAAAAVFGVPDEVWGQIVAIAVVPRAAAGPTDPAILAAALRAHVDEHLATHKRPRRWALLPELPFTSSGKLDRRATAQAAGPLLHPLTLHGAPDPIRT